MGSVNPPNVTSLVKNAASPDFGSLMVSVWDAPLFFAVIVATELSPRIT